MTEAAPLDRMQKIADYRTTCRFLRRSGKQAIVYGCFSLFIGAMTHQFQDPLYSYLYLVLGSIELIVGLRNRFKPSAVGVILDGCLLILIGAWMTTVQLLAIFQGLNNSWIALVIGPAFIGIAIQRFYKYGHAREAFREPPTEEQISWFDEVIAEIKAAKVAETPDMVEFRAGFLWKGRKLGDVLIFVDKLDFDNLIADRRDVDFTDKGKALFGGGRIVKLRIGRRTFRFAEIRTEMLALLEEWGADEEPPEPSPEDEPHEEDV
jgi:hypothetical protein